MKSVLKNNDEARMTKDEGSPNAQMTNGDKVKVYKVKRLKSVGARCFNF
jgi:hypothetical protein